MAKREIKNPAEGLFNTGEAAGLPGLYEPADDASPPEPDPGAPESGLVATPTAKEARTVRKQIVLPPTVALKADRKARALGISLNEAVNQLVAKWVEAE